jgi:hypothetical protein
MAIYCGHVYCLYLPIAAKEKLLVPVYILPDDRVRFFVINSNLTQFTQDKPEIALHAIPIQQTLNNRFLTHDSWLVCNEVVAGWTSAQIDAQNNCYRGQLDQTTLVSVRTLITSSRLYSQTEKNLILSHWP